MFAKVLVAGWGDMDFNGHMRNTAYLDKSADVRMMYFSENGFPMTEFVRRRLGPVVMKEELEYFKEVGLLSAQTRHWRPRSLVWGVGSTSRRGSLWRPPRLC